MLGKLIYSLVNNCKKGWRFGLDSCFFNTRLMLSILISLNIAAVLYFIFDKKTASDYLFFSNDHHCLLKFIYPLSLFILIWALYPKSKVLAYDLSQVEQKKHLKYYLVYVILSIGILICVTVLK